MSSKRLLLLLSLLLLATACTSPQTAAGSIAGQATANPDLVSTAQADQYQRDAAATLTSQDMTRDALALQIQQTAVSSTGTAASQQAQATATTGFQQTTDALSFAQTAESATIQAQITRSAATAQVEATVMAQARQDAIATGTAVTVATAASFQATRQSFELSQTQAAAQRAQVVTIVTTVLLVVAAVLAIGLLALFLWRVMPTLVGRASVVRYGQHGQPLLLMGKDGRTILTDPLRMLQAAITVDENGRVQMPELTPNDLQTLVAGGAMRTLIEQVRHAPAIHPCCPRKSAPTGGWAWSNRRRLSTTTGPNCRLRPVVRSGLLYRRWPALSLPKWLFLMICPCPSPTYSPTWTGSKPSSFTGPRTRARPPCSST